MFQIVQLCLQVPLGRLLLETDAPEGRPRLGEPYESRLKGVKSQSGSDGEGLNHPVNIRFVLSGSKVRIHKPQACDRQYI